MRTETISLAAALLLHAALLAARFVIPTPPSDTSGQEASLRTIDVDTLELPKVMMDRPREPLEQPTAASTEPRPNLDPRRLNPATGAPTPGAVEPMPPGPEPTTNPNAPPGPTPDQYSGPPDKGPGGVLSVPGLGSPIWAMPGVVPDATTPKAAPTEAPKPRPVDKDIAGSVIREAMRTNDKQIGLDLPAAGTVASILEQAVYASDAPDVSRASFEVRLGPDGKVQSVRVAGFVGGTAELWERLARDAAKAMSQKKLAMNEAHAKGATVYVNVNSVSQLPSGSASVIRPSGLGASFDVSDFGANKRRVVKKSYKTVATR